MVGLASIHNKPKGWPSTHRHKLASLKIVKQKDVNRGITGTLKVTLKDGKVVHDASVQRIDEFKQMFQPQGGKAELNFKDTYKFNMAAYDLAKMIGIGDMVPAHAQRSYGGTNASFSWWIDDFMFEEGDRVKQNASSPNQDAWVKENDVIRVFDQLIANTDRNAGNLIIDKQWRVWIIDHTRAFRIQKDLRNPGALTRVDRTMLEKMKALDEPGLKKQLGKYLNNAEIQGLLARRDLIVAAFAARGESALIDRPKR